MRWRSFSLAGIIVVAVLLCAADGGTVEEQLSRHRSLGQAFYENPTTQQQAVAEFREALRLAPGSARERLNLGVHYKKAGDSAEAIRQFEQMATLTPGEPMVHYQLGSLYRAENRAEPA